MTVLLWILGLLKGAWTRLLQPVIQWLFADWRNAPLAILLLTVAAHQFLIDPRLRAERAAAEAERDQIHQALDQTVEGYRQAQLQAALDDAANKQRVESEQARISKEIAGDYETRIAAARARAASLAEQLRGATAATDRGGPGAAPVPGLSTASSGAAEASGGTGLPASGATLSLDERLVATEQAIQLDALISWIQRQARIDPNGDRGAKP